MGLTACLGNLIALHADSAETALEHIAEIIKKTDVTAIRQAVFGHRLGIEPELPGAEVISIRQGISNEKPRG